MLIICRNLLKLFEIKLILVVIFTKREVLVVCGEMEGSHGPVGVSGPSTSAMFHSWPPSGQPDVATTGPATTRNISTDVADVLAGIFEWSVTSSRIADLIVRPISLLITSSSRFWLRLTAFVNCKY